MASTLRVLGDSNSSNRLVSSTLSANVDMDDDSDDDGDDDDADDDVDDEEEEDTDNVREILTNDYLEG